MQTPPMAKVIVPTEQNPLKAIAKKRTGSPKNRETKILLRIPNQRDLRSIPLLRSLPNKNKIQRLQQQHFIKKRSCLYANRQFHSLRQNPHFP
jgi:hypothetical protein